MIYRLYRGASSGWKKRLVGSAMILAVTAGFPVLGAWLNYENLSLDPETVVQDTDSAVLGHSTEKAAAPPDPAAAPAPPAASRSVNPPPARTSSQTPRTQRHSRQTVITPPAAVSEPAPALSVTPAPADEAPSTSEGSLLPFEVLDPVEDTVTIDPQTITPDLDL